jgi:AraC-like DNA-binding protein
MRTLNTLTIGADRSLYIGALPTTGWHAHAAPALLVGLSGRFALHLPDGSTETCWSALIVAGQHHLFDPRGEFVAVVYLEPDSLEARSLRSHFDRIGGVVVDPVKRLSGVNSVERYLNAFDLSALLPWKLATGKTLDARVTHVLRCMRTSGMSAPTRDHAARMVGLSTSRFNHLFREEMGVSFRSYRMWSQVRGAIATLATQPSLTRAALDGGFVDSSHFSHAFRNTFGMTPSSVLKPLQSVILL